MLKKELEKPLKILKMEAILRRLPPDHPKIDQIKSELAKSKAGYRGEKGLEYYFSFLPKEKYLIFQSLRLLNREHYFQMDALILSPFFILILEVKNIAGTLYFDHEFNQMIRTLAGEEEGFLDPHLQVKMHYNLLIEWLAQYRLQHPPIEFFIVISQPSTIIKSSNPKSTKIIHAARLLAEIGSLERKYADERLSKKEIKKLTTLFLKKHTPQNTDILQQFEIGRNEIKKGVHCPSCFQLTMKRGHGAWICTSCMYKSKLAHIDSIRDYALLISSTITNQELRGFLQVSSRILATNILASMNLKHTGDTKGRKYMLLTNDGSFLF